VVPPSLCDRYVEAFRSRATRARSYQGQVDLRLRDCQYLALDDVLPGDPRADLVAEAIPAFFGVRAVPLTGQPTMVYRYGVGVGFVPHHDEVTDVEVERARTNGQPVLHGDITVVYVLSSPSSYGGGALTFFDPHRELRPERGTAVLFPARRNVRHAVEEVTAGERFTLLYRVGVVGP
jgi:PKHD-type hydroxylase